MRSAVSTILSDMSEPAQWAFPDYDLTSDDHRSVLVLVRAVGAKAKGRTVQRVVETLSRGCTITVNKTSSSASSTLASSRNIEFRFVKSYPTENNEWSEFQVHRGVVGIVSVGCRRLQAEHDEIITAHESLKMKYAKSLNDSLLIVLNEEDCVEDGHSTKEGNPPVDPSEEAPRSPTSSAGRHLSLTYDGAFNETRLESDIHAFLLSLFCALDRTRLEKTALESSGRVPLMCAPFERKDFIGLDLESRGNRKRTLGRFKKHLGDIYLLCGMPLEAHGYYNAAAETLRSCNDWLWLANALEGMCAVGVMAHFPHLRRKENLRRNSSFQELKDSRARAASAGLRKSHGQASPDEMLKIQVLEPARLVEALREAVVHYSKYRHAGLIETEASIKAIRMLTEQGNNLCAAEFLQNIVFINLHMNDEEKIQRFYALSRLYGRLGFQRKASFFLRVAAMRCVAPQNPHTDWQRCYDLMMKALPGYRLNVHGSSHTETHSGWPSLQLQLFQELVGTARRMGDHLAATRHQAFIVQNLSQASSPEEKVEMCQQLAFLSGKASSGSGPSAGIPIPPVTITALPKVTGFKALPLAETFVSNAVDAAASAGPFLFTPIQSSKASDVVEWVQGEIVEVALTVINPLNMELNVTAMSLLHEGVAFETFPSNFCLSKNSGPQTILLSGEAKEAGDLRLTGYACTVLGVRSQCRLRAVGLAHSVDVRVVPHIPRLDVQLCVVQTKLGEAPDDTLLLYNGEVKEAELVLTNGSTLPLTEVKIGLDTTPPRFRSLAALREACDVVLAGERVILPIRVFAPPTECVSAAPAPANDRKFSVQVSVSYSCDKDASREFRRQVVERMHFSCLRSFEVNWWDVLPGESADECYVIVDLSNRTDGEAEIVFGPARKRIAIDGEGACRIPLSVKKVSAEGENAADKKTFFLRYLDREMDLAWELGQPVRRSGKISLLAMSLSDEIMSRLEISPVSWSIAINGEPWSGAELNVAPGTPIRVTIAIANKRESPSAVECRFSTSWIYDAIKEAECVKRSRVQCSPGATVTHRALFVPTFAGKVCLRSACDIVWAKAKADADGLDQLAEQHLQLPDVSFSLQ